MSTIEQICQLYKNKFDTPNIKTLFNNTSNLKDTINKIDVNDKDLILTYYIYYIYYVIYTTILKELIKPQPNYLSIKTIFNNKIDFITKLIDTKLTGYDPYQKFNTIFILDEQITIHKYINDILDYFNNPITSKSLEEATILHNSFYDILLNKKIDYTKLHNVILKESSKSDTINHSNLFETNIKPILDTLFDDVTILFDTDHINFCLLKWTNLIDINIDKLKVEDINEADIPEEYICIINPILKENTPVNDYNEIIQKQIINNMLQTTYLEKKRRAFSVNSTIIDHSYKNNLLLEVLLPNGYSDLNTNDIDNELIEFKINELHIIYRNIFKKFFEYTTKNPNLNRLYLVPMLNEINRTTLFTLEPYIVLISLLKTLFYLKDTENIEEIFTLLRIIKIYIFESNKHDYMILYNLYSIIKNKIGDYFYKKLQVPVDPALLTGLQRVIPSARLTPSSTAASTPPGSPGISRRPGILRRVQSLNGRPPADY